MNAKIDESLNQEILIGETASEELSDEILENVAGGFSLNFTKIEYGYKPQKEN